MRLIYIFPVVLVIFSFLACAQSRPLGGSYYLVDIDSNHRSIQRRSDQEAVTVIDQQVVGHRKQGNYILVHRMVAISYECVDDEGVRTIITHRTDEEEYWILDVEGVKELGPFGKNELAEAAQRLKIESMDIPRKISYKENTSGFKIRSSRCVDLEQISWGKGMNH